MKWKCEIFVFVFFVVFDDILALNTCAPKSCKLGLEARKAVCGSDGFSYPNRCHLEMARCRNENITFVDRGPCKRPKTCTEYANAHPTYKFKPTCKPDGTFAKFQCSPEVGYCWCVSPNGRPVPATIKRHKPGIKGRCGRAGKKITRSSHKNQRQSRNCSWEDKALFNRNLLHIFKSDWLRDHSAARGSAINDSLVLEWKFHKMDLDHNENLDKNEYKDLKRLVKKVVKPKRCAKSFAKACDMNRDQVIGKLEWAQCLTRDGMDDVGGQSGADDSQDPDEEEDPEMDGGDVLDFPLPPVRTVRPDILVDNTPYHNPTDMEDTPDHSKDEDVTDCKADRKLALEEGSQLDYVPECTLDGRYAKVQCYKSAGYCWCVNEDTGKNIPGTSLKDKMPNCDSTTVTRPMKGCPEEKKVAFLEDLMNYLHANMLRETIGSSIPGSREERIAAWSFIYYDKNKNKFLDKAEWKAFKDAMSSVKNLKRCGKKLPRYCDINKDRLISLTEWQNCLNANQHQVTSTSRPNPLSILIE